MLQLADAGEHMIDGFLALSCDGCDGLQLFDEILELYNGSPCVSSSNRSAESKLIVSPAT